MLLHVQHAVTHGHSNVVIRTVDSDVVIIAVYTYRMIHGIQHLWIDFGVGKSRRYIAVHEISTELPPYISENLPFFHAFTGCDTVATFCGIGKKSAWKTWKIFRDVDDCFKQLSIGSCGIDDVHFKALQRFVVLMYDRSSPCQNVNQCRRILYTRRNRSIENIPPTADALLQHTLRAALQAHIWTECLCPNAVNYSPADWGWKSVDGVRFEPLWSTLPDVTKYCRELIACS